jgi:hypothetical protein
MAQGKPVTEKVGDWYQAFEAIRMELTPQSMRSIVDVLKGAGDPGSLASMERAARMIAANDRAAAIAAAIITQSGVSRPVLSPDCDADHD